MRRWAIIAAAAATVAGVVVAVAALTHDTSGSAAGAANADAPEGRANAAPAGPAAPDPAPSDVGPDPDPHVPRDRRPAGGRPRIRSSTCPASDFARQIGWLERQGYHAVTLRDAYRHWRFGRSVPAHPLVLTFDDGYHSQFATAAPILRSHGWVGVLDLEVRNTERSWGLSEKQVRLLIAGRLGARGPHADASRPDAAPRRRAAARGSRLTRRAPRDVRRAGRLLLLSGRAAQRRGGRRGASRRVPRCDDDRAGSRDAGRSLPAQPRAGRPERRRRRSRREAPRGRAEARTTG